MEKGKVLLIALILLALCGGGALYYFYLKDLGKVEPIDEGYQFQKADEADVTESWHVYDNEKYSYQIKYPLGWYYHRTGFNPLPPTQIFMASVPKGKTFGEYSSFTVIVNPYTDGNLENHPEVKSLESKGYEKSVITVAGRRAVRMDNDLNGLVYVLKGKEIFRLNWESTSEELSERHKDVFEEILKG